MTNLTHHHEVLDSLGCFITQRTDAHVSRQQLWFPSELLERAPERFDLPPEIIVLLVLNTLTEEGLPSFHRLLATHLGEAAPLVRWTDLWTAEEDRHGTVLRDYLLRVRNVRMVEVEKMQYAYQCQGFRPDWQRDPYQLLAYTCLQEWATQIAHQGLARILGDSEPVLGNVLRKIAGEEAKHLAFYRTVFGKILERDPNGALVALARVIGVFSMPGLSIPGFNEMTRLSNHLGMFTPLDFLSIVEGTSKFLALKRVDRLGDDGKKARDFIERRSAVIRRAYRPPVNFQMPKFAFLN